MKLVNVNVYLIQVFAIKQSWNEDRGRCEFQELIDEGSCDKGFIWITTKCECECD